MKKYEVTLIKYETYEVEAENEAEALELAYGLEEEDCYAWLDPVDESRIVEVK